MDAHSGLVNHIETHPKNCKTAQTSAAAGQSAETNAYSIMHISMIESIVQAPFPRAAACVMLTGASAAAEPVGPAVVAVMPSQPDTRRSSLYSLTRRWLARLRPMSRSTCANAASACSVL